MATKDVAFYNNTVADHKTVNLCVVSYEIFAADRDAETSQELDTAAEARGLRPITADYKQDEAYNPYPGKLPYMITNFPIVFGLPTFTNDFGYLWMYKNSGKIPDIAYDGIFCARGVFARR